MAAAPAAATAQWTKDNIYNALKSHNTLAKWDVMVAFDLEFVNAELQTSAASKENEKVISQEDSIAWPQPGDSYTHAPAEKRTISWKFGMPTMQFYEGKGDPQATLTMSMTGTYTRAAVRCAATLQRGSEGGSLPCAIKSSSGCILLAKSHLENHDTEKEKFLEIKRDTGDNEGIKFTAKLPDREIQVAGISVTLERGANGDSGQYKIVESDKTSFNVSPKGDGSYKDAPLATFNLRDSSSSMSWQGELKNIHFTYRYNDQYRQREGKKQGYATLTLYMDQLNVSWENGADDEITLKFSMQDSFKTKDLKKGDEGDFWSAMSGFSDDTIPRALLGISANFGTFKFTAGINYFLASNLLFGGRTVFRPDTAGGNGVSLPADMFVLGPKKPATATALAMFAPLSGGNTTRSPRVQKLQAALLEKDGKFAQKLIAALSNNDPAGDGGAVHTVLASQGLEDITAEELTHVTRISDGSAVVAASMESIPSNGIYAMFVETPDLKEFAAVYTISSPSSLKGKFLTVNPHTGKIAIQGDDKAMKEVSNLAVTNSGEWPEASFNCFFDGKNYAFSGVKFTTDLNPSTSDFTVDFSGAVAPDGDEGFKGSKAVHQEGKSSFEGFTDFNVVYGFIFTTIVSIISIGFGIQAWYWHAKDKKAGKDAAADPANATALEMKHYDILKVNVADLKKDIQSVKDGIQVAAELQSGKATDAARMSHIRTQLENDLKTEFTHHTNAMDLSPLDPADPQDPSNTYDLVGLHSKLEAKARTTLETALSSDRTVLINKILQPYEDSAIITQTEKVTIRDAVVKTIAESMLTALKSDTSAGGPSYMTSHTRGLLATKIKTDANANSAAAARNVVTQNAAKVAAQTKLNTDQALLQSKNAQLQGEQDAPKIAQLNNDIANLNHDITTESAKEIAASAKEGQETVRETTERAKEHEAGKEEGTAKSEADVAFKEV
ncbi:hypothetical protein M7I_6948 [Glarea lozoyensis 74030]|uniref:Uncharacterized protein n=1 Tax=Glarea lozoyensis (strain ATCC 74030 / MF5533) TaxID=1104152 RepID=H0EVZ0_GLAL7|nr:hypothetical protein M7I_6948 [Glarea lozoyensis 74030]